MAVISRGQKAEYVEEIKTEGVFTQQEYEGHLGVYHKQGDEGWKDNIINFTRIKTGNPDKQPLWIDTGNGLFGYMFSDYNDNVTFADFHINHDYKPNSPIYPHIHWMPLSHSTGNVRWEIIYTVAKGHQQNESLTETPTTIILDANGKGLIGEHFVTEADLSQTFTCSEPDVVVKARVRRLGSDPNDTFYGGVIGIMIDFHYESDKDFTVNKAPDFFTGDFN